MSYVFVLLNIFCLQEEGKSVYNRGDWNYFFLFTERKKINLSNNPVLLIKTITI